MFGGAVRRNDVGVCLYFTMREAAPKPVEAAIRSELVSLLRGQHWFLCEPPWFFPPEEGQPLRGRTKLNVDPPPAEAAAFDEREPDDIQAIVTALEGWSERYGVSWVLDIDGWQQGRIKRGRCGWCLRRRMRATAEWLKQQQRKAVRAAPGAAADRGDT
jgi:hypothetical protein